MANRKPVIVPAGKFTTRLPTGTALPVKSYFPVVLTDDTTQMLLIDGSAVLPVVLTDGTNTTMPIGLNG